MDGLNSARFKDLMASNDALMDQETSYLRNMALNRRQRLHELQTVIKKLVEEQDELKSELVDLDRLLHPVRGLPVDVLSHIFWFCVDTYITPGGPHIPRRVSEFPNDSSLNTTQSPWNLGKVSKRWRYVVEGDPRLWSEVRVCVGTRRAKKASSLLRFRRTFSVNHDELLHLGYLLNLHLRRASAHPLSVSISVQEEASPSDPMLQFFLQTLLASSRQWRYLSLHLDPGLFPIFHQLEGAVPNLQNVYMWGKLSANPPSARAFQFLATSPRLKVVAATLKGPTELPLPWSQLRTLRDVAHAYPNLATPTLRSRLNIAIAAPQLTILTISCGCDFIPPPRTLITMPNLENLSIWHVGRKNVECSSLLPFLTTPKLKTLSISGNFDVQAVLEAKERSGFALLRLGIQTVEDASSEWSSESSETEILLDPGDMMPILEASPTLSFLRLCMVMSGSESSIINALSDPKRIQGSENPFLPSLNHINIVGHTALLGVDVLANVKLIRPNLRVWVAKPKGA